MGQGREGGGAGRRGGGAAGRRDVGWRGGGAAAEWRDGRLTTPGTSERQWRENESTDPIFGMQGARGQIVDEATEGGGGYA